MILQIGTVLSDRYEIVEKLGSGGMAIVYRAKDKKLERFVTMKVLRDEFTADEEFKSRFKIEARSAASLSHPNIVNVYDVGEDGNIYYIVMEYVHGDTLKKAIIEKAPFDSVTAISVAIQMASALAHAHKNHIVHRDIKPQNILVATDGTIKVTDFGIARAATAATVTTTANAIGSVHYFSPEQARGGYVDEKSDIYSLGITLFEMVTGRLPYEGDTSVAIALKHLNDDLPNIRDYNPNISKSLEGIIKKATRKKSDERYANINLFLSDLKKSLSDTSGGFISETTDSDYAPTVQMSKEELQYIHAGKAHKTADAVAAATSGLAKDEIKVEIMGAKDRRRVEADSGTADSFLRKEVNEIEIPDIITRRKAKTDVEKPEAGISKKINHNIEIPESNVGFDKYKKKLKISKDDDYYDEFEEMPNEDDMYEDDEYDDDDKRQEKKVIIAAVITAVVIISIITVAGFKFFGGGTGKSNIESTANSIVPNFTGMTLAQAESKADEMGVTIEKKGEETSKLYEEGLIISQTVEEGTAAKKGDVIGVTLSSGLESFDMPDVKDMEVNDAEKLIKQRGAEDVSIEYENDEVVPVGTVISQQPLKGTKITKDSKVILTVSKGEELKKVVVPDVENQTESAARKQLESLGLVVGTITPMESDKIEEGKVITQTIPAGDEVMKNSIVGLVVSTGKAKEEITEDNLNTEKPEASTPSGNTEPPIGTEPTTPPTGRTKTFTINLPTVAEGAEAVHIKILQIGEGGTTTTAFDGIKKVSEFPFEVPITGTGQMEVRCFADDSYQWSEKVDFSEGGN